MTTPSPRTAVFHLIPSLTQSDMPPKSSIVRKWRTRFGVDPAHAMPPMWTSAPSWWRSASCSKPSRSEAARRPPRRPRLGILLTRHGDAQALVRGDQVIVVLGAGVEVDLHPVHLAGEGVACAGSRRSRRRRPPRRRRTSRRRRRSWPRCVDPALADLLAVEVERDRAALAQPAAVVGELHPHLVLAGGHRRRSPST